MALRPVEWSQLTLTIHCLGTSLLWTVFGNIYLFLSLQFLWCCVVFHFNMLVFWTSLLIIETEGDYDVQFSQYCAGFVTNLQLTSLSINQSINLTLWTRTTIPTQKRNGIYLYSNPNCWGPSIWWICNHSSRSWHCSSSHPSDWNIALPDYHDEYLESLQIAQIHHHHHPQTMITRWILDLLYNHHSEWLQLWGWQWMDS